MRCSADDRMPVLRYPSSGVRSLAQSHIQGGGDHVVANRCGSRLARVRRLNFQYHGGRDPRQKLVPQSKGLTVVPVPWSYRRSGYLYDLSGYRLNDYPPKNRKSEVTNEKRSAHCGVHLFGFRDYLNCIHPGRGPLPCAGFRKPQ